ncbi:hypothetical protein ACIA6D_42595 [Streptomyces cacaoi]|uniref:hypothetical protein n=1 Tax=Streptomyces cacaoi TaxID=1898 RepID=UPI0037488793
MVPPLIARDDHGAEVCGPCVGFAADYTCHQCGRVGNPHSRGRCAHCVLAERVNALQTDVRAAGAITLLFGPSTERLCHLTPEHLKFGDKHAHLVLGRHPVLLPPRLAELLRRLAEQPQLRPQLSRSHPGPRWLFPVMVPGKPISTHGMTLKPGRHDIPVRTARNAAPAALAAVLPSPILADVTGMHRHTALRWVAYARRDWAEYLAARAADAEERDRH